MTPILQVTKNVFSMSYTFQFVERSFLVAGFACVLSWLCFNVTFNKLKQVSIGNILNNLGLGQILFKVSVSVKL